MAGKAVPKGLGAAGRRLWRAAVAEYEFDAAEVELLRTACSTVDELARIETALAEAGSLTVKGSTGQPRAHPLLEEARRHRAVLARLVAALDLPDEVAVVPALGGRVEGVVPLERRRRANG